jgi:hypothetical protein
MSLEDRCGRCRKNEDMPTHQGIKFDDRVRYLCGYCDEALMAWYNRKSRGRASTGNQQQCGRCKEEETIPDDHTIKPLGRDEIYFCDNCWGEFENWYYRNESKQGPETF